MAKRFTDTDIWKTQRWFRKLTPVHKLVFCYIKDQCHHSGVWKIDCSDLVEDLGLGEFNLQNFISDINTEYDKITGNKIIKERVKIVKDNYLWITGFIQFQYQNREGKVSNEAAPVKTALQYLQGLDILIQGLDKGYIVLVQPLDKGSVRAKDKDKDKDKDNKKGVQGETFVNPFWFQQIYDKPYTDYKAMFNGRSASEENFDLWKYFIDFIKSKGYEELFQSKFINPKDFETLVTANGFTKDKWDDVVKNILATGVKPEHNLLYRIPQFMGYNSKNKITDPKTVKISLK